MPTPHNSAAFGDFAPTVLMPGDPLRSRYIAETFLTDARLVNDVRGIQGYTGLYHGKRVSVMASGMGTASIGIYAHELYNMYGVENIIRVGSAGVIDTSLKIGSVVAAMSAYTNSAFGKQFGFNGDLAPVCDFGLLEKAVAEARKRNIPMPVGPVFTSNAFYGESDGVEKLARLGVLAVEMEAAALYLTAAAARKKALALLTITDNQSTGESLSPLDRQTRLTDMIEIALEIA